MLVRMDHADYDPPAQVTNLPSWLTGQVAATGARLVGATLADEGLRRQHFVVLSALAERGAASQAALGRRLSIDRSDMHAVLGELERRRLVARVRDRDDRRRKLVELTPAGARAQHRLEQQVQAAQEALLAPLSVAERRQLSRLLTRLVEHHAAGDPAAGR
jgi:MarR family transcriptional regulator, lower aerobic nicotinate degradation pathway regulator